MQQQYATQWPLFRLKPVGWPPPSAVVSAHSRTYPFATGKKGNATRFSEESSGQKIVRFSEKRVSLSFCYTVANTMWLQKAEKRLSLSSCYTMAKRKIVPVHIPLLSSAKRLIVPTTKSLIRNCNKDKNFERTWLIGVWSAIIVALMHSKWPSWAARCIRRGNAWNYSTNEIRGHILLKIVILSRRVLKWESV